MACESKTVSERRRRFKARGAHGGEAVKEKGKSSSFDNGKERLTSRR
jgi:hypothetical protein